MRKEDFLILFYIPVPDQKTGEFIAKTLLSEKLIACANILPPHVAMYEWKGKVTRQSESIMILKSRHSLKPAIQAEVEKLHPYDCPCILTIDPVTANPMFLEWVEKQTETVQGIL